MSDMAVPADRRHIDALVTATIPAPTPTTIVSGFDGTVTATSPAGDVAFVGAAPPTLDTTNSVSDGPPTEPPDSMATPTIDVTSG